MFQSPILDVVIGMIFLFLLLSLLATAIQEAIAGRNNLRGKLLKTALFNMVGDDFAQKILKHPLVVGNKMTSTRLPSYIDKENFTRALMKQITGYTGLPENLRTFDEKLNTVPDDSLREVLKSFGAKTEEQLREKAGEWFEMTMDRWSGYYKRNMQKRLFWLGLVIAVVMNADAIGVFKHLSTNDEARKAVVEQAIQFAEENEGSEDLNIKAEELLEKEIDRENEGLKNTLGIGWYWTTIKNEWTDADTIGFKISYVLSKILGWVISAYAITIGAPFWFDMLKKVVQIRHTGKKPEEKK